MVSETRQESKALKTGWPQSVVGKEASRLVERRDLINIAILTAIALVIGVYLIATTVLIARDGAMHIEYAKSISSDSVGAVHEMYYSAGYPFLIHLMHKVTGLFNDTESIQGWILSAQLVSLLSKVIASVALYLVGRCLVGSRMSFWGVLILSILPDSAAFGSDALPEWPHLMFLTTGFLLLLLGAQYRKSWMFGWAGIMAGLGYLVRTEGCQLILYGSAWLSFNLVRPQGKMKRAKAAGALILLLAGFALIAVPYMRSEGYVFPEQGMWKLPASLSFSDSSLSPIINANRCLAGLSIRGITGNETLITNMSETLVYYFVPGLLIGCYFYFRKQSKTMEQTFFAAAFIIVNIAILLWQSSCRDFLSRRHTLALVVFTIFYIPIGLHTIARWLSERNPKNNVSMQKNVQQWFSILLVIGMAICLPKLLRPMRIDKQGYLDAAIWLKENTKPEDIIAVPDNRISFYAERKGYLCEEDVDTGVTASDVMKTAIKQAETTKNRNNFSASVFIVKTVKVDTKTMLAGTVEYPSSRKGFPLAEISRYSSLKNLVGYWPDGTIEDLSVYNNTTTLCGDLSCVESKYGQCYSLTDNSDGYVNCGNSPVLNPTNAVSLSVMVYPTSASRGSIVTKNGPYAMEYLGDGKIRTGIYAGFPPTWTHAVTTSSLALNTWHHVVMTYDGAYMKTYLNNKMGGTAVAKSGQMALTESPVFIGYGGAGFNRYFKGMIDEVMIFQKALSEDEINALNEMVESRTAPTFGANVNANPILDCWKIEREYSVWVDERKKKKRLYIYKIE